MSTADTSTSGRPSGEWQEWLDGTLGRLQRAHLMRVPRPTVWINSSRQALIPQADLAAWVAGNEPTVRFYDHNLSNQHQLQYVAGSQQHSQTPSTGHGGLTPLTLFSLNDYLGLASHPDVCAAAASTSSQLGLGPRSSAIVAGYSHVHRALEEELAALKGTEDCLLLPTGFAANMAVLSCLGAPSSTPPPPPSHTPYISCTRVPTSAHAQTTSNANTRHDAISSSSSSSSSSSVAIFSDELNHASIIDGARLAARSGCDLHVYRHNDMEHLDALLSSCSPGVRKLVATDSLFSMDGDFADLKGLVRLKRKHGFLLAVDEAHATLVCGEHGGGAAEALGVAEEVDLHIGTLSKAFGALGGFVATSRALKQLLLNKGRAYVYSTALPLPVVSAASAALRVSQREAWRRTHLWSLVDRLGKGLGVPALSPVVPLVVGPEAPTVALSSTLLRHGLHVPAIRPPTVPQGTCRLRVSLCAAHTTADVDNLIRLVKSALAAGIQTTGALAAGGSSSGSSSNTGPVQLVKLKHLEQPVAAMSGPAGTCMPYYTFSSHGQGSSSRSAHRPWNGPIQAKL